MSLKETLGRSIKKNAPRVAPLILAVSLAGCLPPPKYSTVLDAPECNDDSRPKLNSVDASLYSEITIGGFTITADVLTRKIDAIPIRQTNTEPEKIDDNTIFFKDKETGRSFTILFPKNPPPTNSTILRINSSCDEQK